MARSLDPSKVTKGQVGDFGGFPELLELAPFKDRALTKVPKIGSDRLTALSAVVSPSAGLGGGERAQNKF